MVNASDQTSGPAEGIRAAVTRLREELPDLSGIFDAFVDLLAEQATVREQALLSDIGDVVIDPLRFAQGVPILEKQAFIVPWDSVKEAARRILPAMEKGLPGVREQLALVSEALDAAVGDAHAPLNDVVEGTEEEFDTLSTELGIDPDLLRFTLIQLWKPFAQKRARSMPPIPENITWTKGYCPVCGSWPESSFLEGKEGKRCLRCSFCAHEWSFPRLQCPFCETEDADKIEVLFTETRPAERAELCHLCKQYVVSMDLREIAVEVNRETAALGMVYLDFLAQERGFGPGALCPWNVIG